MMNSNKRKISWNPDKSAEIEERIRCMEMDDKQFWESMMKLITMNRTTPVTFKKRKIKWT